MASEQDLHDRLYACQVQDCPARCTATISSPEAKATWGSDSPRPTAPTGPPPMMRTIPYEGTAVDQRCVQMAAFLVPAVAARALAMAGSPEDGTISTDG